MLRLTRAVRDSRTSSAEASSIESQLEASRVLGKTGTRTASVIDSGELRKT